MPAHHTVVYQTLVLVHSDLRLIDTFV